MNDIVVSTQTFQLESEYTPQGDQPHAIQELVDGIRQGKKHQTLLGATVQGTFTVASDFKLNRPAQLLHNKTLFALASEFRNFSRIIR
jgi:excinuclease ABC subunit B